ncbi:HNH endonuclease [Lacipirellula sp.]|uniref:HNH endonuclease n=1 Tax=Lacipirellula sp. TaxID=2691419 RepID=UPI003D0C2B28
MPSKKTIFASLRRNADEVFPETQGSECVPCPLCLKPISENEATVEHIIPESVDGRLKTLTCKSCNSLTGSRIDSHLQRWHHAQRLHSGSPIPCKVTIGDSTVTAVYKRTEETGVSLEIIGRASNPEHVEKSTDLLTSGVKDEFTVVLELGYSLERVWLALLKSAYLAVFRQQGYEYAVHPAIAPISERILGRSSGGPSLETIVGKIRPSHTAPPWDDEIMIIQGRTVTQNDCFAVIVRTGRDFPSWHLVYLPLANNHVDALHEELEALNEGKRQFSFRIAFQTIPGEHDG